VPFIAQGNHPTLGRPFATCGYVPMVELLRYLDANGFATYIASGGNRDFMRVFTSNIYGIPPERVIGSSNELRFQDDDEGGSVVYQAQPDVFDDGPAKPVRIWSRTADARSSPAGTPTATSRCCGSPAVRLDRRYGCSWRTTTPTGSSTTWPAPRRRSSRQRPRVGPS
jgi:hypothetical protein